MKLTRIRELIQLQYGLPELAKKADRMFVEHFVKIDLPTKVWLAGMILDTKSSSNEAMLQFAVSHLSDKIDNITRDTWSAWPNLKYYDGLLVRVLRHQREIIDKGNQ